MEFETIAMQRFDTGGPMIRNYKRCNRPSDYREVTQSHRKGLTSAVRSLEEVGKILGLTKQRIQQIEKRALAKMRSALEAM